MKDYDCPLCDNGILKHTPTVGRWQCDCCLATLLVGKQKLVQHWPAVEEPEPAPFELPCGGKS